METVAQETVMAILLFRTQSASLFWPPPVFLVFLKHLCRQTAYLTPDTVLQGFLPLPSVLRKHVIAQNTQKGF